MRSSRWQQLIAVVCLAVTTVMSTACTATPSGQAHINGCAPIEWTLNPAGAPAGARQVMERAFAQVGAVTGRTFVYSGTDTTLPQQDWVPRAARVAESNAWPEPLRVVWASERSTSLLIGNEVARTATVHRADGQGTWIIGAAIVFNTDHANDLPRGSAERTDLGSVAVHEIGHALGLAHSDDPQSIMFGGYLDGPSVHDGGDDAELRATSVACVLPAA